MYIEEYIVFKRARVHNTFIHVTLLKEYLNKFTGINLNLSY